MSLKWVLVFLIVLWFLYEGLALHIHDLWARYRVHIKFVTCVILCAIVLSLPSLESFLARHRDLAQFLQRDVLRVGTLSTNRVPAHTRVLQGTHMVADAETTDVNPTHAECSARVLSDVEKRVVAAQQQWKCYRCLEPLRADYRVQLFKQAQQQASSIDASCIAAAMCPRCFAEAVLVSQ